MSSIVSRLWVAEELPSSLKTMEISGHLNKQYTFSCSQSQCDKSFRTKSSLNWHLKSHQPEAALPCQDCGKKFYSKTTLKNHILLHRKEKPHKCAECEASFTQKVSLTLHMRKHTGVLPFPCNYCKIAGFSYRNALKKHWATEHSEIYLGTRSFLCELCWEPFDTENELEVHITAVHERHKCQVCGFQFKMLAHLKEHLLRHSRLKPFACKRCPDLKFMRRAGLRKHVCDRHPGQNLTDCEQSVVVDVVAASGSTSRMKRCS